MSVINISSKEEFEEKVINNKKLVLVDFWAAWCPPCVAMAPILHQVDEKLSDEIDVIKVDIEENTYNQDLAVQSGVQGIPNMQVYKNGKKVDEIVGMRPLGVLEKELKNHIS